MGLHFTLQVSEGGKQKFTIDPKPLGTYLVDGWYGKEHEYKLVMPFAGENKAKSVRILRKKFPADAMNTSSFGLAGIKGKLDFIRLAKVKPLNFCKIVVARSGKKTNETIKKARERERSHGKAL